MKRITESFIPFLLLLLGIFAIVIYTDLYAEEATNKIEIIEVSENSISENETLLEFEIDESQKNKSHEILAKNPDYQNAVTLYQTRKYKTAREHFISIDLKYANNIIIKNYLGLISLKLNEYKDAEALFQYALAIDSSHISSRLNLGIVYTKLHQFKNAEHMYLEAQKINPNHTKAHLNLGLLYFKQDLWTSAIQQFENSRALASGKLKAKSLCYLGISQLQLGDTTNAVLNLNEAINLRPDYELARIYLSNTKTSSSEKEKELLKIHQLKPNSFNALMHLALFYESEKKNEKANQYFKKALEIKPDDEQIIEQYTTFLVQHERFDEAELVISALSPTDTLPQTYFYKARIASNKGDIQNAIKYYNIAIDKSKNNYPEAHLNKAVLYKKQGKKIQAIENYKAAIKYKEAYPLAYYNLALLYSETDSTEAAIKNYKLAITYEPNNYKSWFNLGSLYKKQKQYKQALDAYLASTKANPQYLKGMAAIASTHQKMGKRKKAIKQYDKLLIDYPNYSKGWFNLGLLLRKEKDYEKAIQAYEKVIAIDPNNTKARINIGALYAREHKIEMAIKSFEEAADIDMNNAEIRYNLALQYSKKQRFSDAINQYSKTIQIDRKYVKAYDKLIDLHLKTGDITNSNIILYRKLLLEPKADTLYAIGKILHESKEYKHAINAYKTAKKHGAKAHWCNYWIGKAYMDQKELKKAESYLKKALKLRPKHKFSLYRMGQIRELQGKTKAANQFYKKLLKLDPNFKIKHKSFQ